MNITELLEKANEGQINPLEAYAKLKQELTKVQDAIKEIEEEAQAEAAKFGEKTFEYRGYKFELRNGATRYSFKNINEWVEANKAVKDLEAKYKQAYQASKKGITALSEDAEVLKLPEVTHSKDSLTVKPIKNG